MAINFKPTNGLNVFALQYVNSQCQHDSLSLKLATKLHLFTETSKFATDYFDSCISAAIIYTFMGRCELAQVDVRKWLNHFFTHIHEYDHDYSRDLMELLLHSLKQRGVLCHTMNILQQSQIYYQNLRESSDFSETFSNFFGYFQRISQYEVY